MSNTKQILKTKNICDFAPNFSNQNHIDPFDASNHSLSPAIIFLFLNTDNQKISNFQDCKQPSHATNSTCFWQD